nr:hypothetical protein 9.5 kDa [uncultured bacterium]
MKTLIALLACTFAAGAHAATTAEEQGPAPLAASFMSQFYDVPADAVTVTVIEQTRFDAKVRAEAAGHVCTFDAGQLPAAKYGWAVASMKCGE